MEPSRPPALKRQFSKSTLDREAYLLKYVTEKVENRVEITIAEGWGILKEYGFTVLFDTLTDEAKQNKAPFGNKGFSSLYTIGFRLVSCGEFMDHSSQIYANLTEEVRGFLTERVVAPLLDANLAGTPMIAKFSQAWENTKSMTKWVHRLFAHLDNGYVINSGGAFPTVVGLCMSMFRDVAFSGTCERVRTGTLRLVEEERDGKDVDREAIRSCVEVFKVVGGLERSQCLTVATVEKLLKRDQDLSIYRSEFEEPFLLESQQYYEKKAEIWREDSVPAYLKRCEKSLADELERASRYLHPNTEPALVLRVEKALLSGVKGSIQTELVERVGTGMLAMLHGDQRDDLKRMFDLFSREGANLKEVPMAECFERFVSSEGCKIIDIRRAEVAALPAGKKETAADGTGTVVALLNLYARCEAMVVELFSRHLSFQRAIRNAFQIFINDNASEKVSNTELLVAYVDALLKGKEGTEKLDEGQQQERLDNSMRLFEFIADKDVYEALFKDALAKRLLNNKVTSMDMEMHIVTKLKLAQGPPFTANIEGMLTDFKLIDESSSEFAAYLASSHPSAPESSNPLLGGGGGSGSLSSAQAAGALGAPLGRTEQRVQLLTNGFWPLQGGAEGIVLSGTFATLVNRYTSFFEEKHSGKKVLKWKHTLGECEVDARYPGGKKYTLVLTTLQAMGLCRIAEMGGRVSAEALQESLSIDIEIVKRVLHSLACGKFKILSKTGPGGDRKIDPRDEVQVNPGFKNPKLRFSVPMSSLDFASAIKSKAVEDRGPYIDACIVRIMKARKRMAHGNLISEVMQQLNNFRPEASTVKRRIESLIDRDFLARHEADGAWTREYDYLA